MKFYPLFSILLFSPSLAFALNPPIDDNFARLKFNNPDGYAILTQMSDLKVFNFFTEPDGINASIYTLDTGIHESLHELDSELKKTECSASYYLMNGKIVDAPQIKTFYRSEVLNLLNDEEKKDGYVSSYLSETGNQGLEVLLDELNAYAHGANTVIDLSENEKNKNPINPGLMAIMFFTEKYLALASNNHPDIYSILKNTPYRKTIDLLWSQAESVVSRACSSKYAYIYPNDRPRINKIYNDNSRHSFEKFLGHSLRIPVDCK